ncbi:MAG: J domain-containing protein [Kiritimatiellae bacterium]|nr:J domain-containing protein [Kiritimatiellia bacterium]
MKSYYAILGLTRHATPRDIRSAYRQLAKEYHPDRWPGDSTEFVEIQEAYSVLSDPARREAYDQHYSRHVRPVEPVQPRAGRTEPEPLIPDEKPADLGEISVTRSFETVRPSLDEIFDWLWRNYRSLSHAKADEVRSLALEVPLTREQARRGGQARIHVPAQATCPTCRGFGGVGPYECGRCGGEGAITGEMPVWVSFPAGLAADHTVLVALDRFGIRNTYLEVRFRITDEPVE